MSKTADTVEQNNETPVLLIASTDKSNSLDEMLKQGRSMSGKERNACFLNTLSDDNANGRFATISAISGLNFPDDGRAAALVDWDFDGDMDLWLTNRNAPRVRLMRNENDPTNQFVQLKLIGNGTDTNTNAVGARVAITFKNQSSDNPVKLIKTLRAGDGFLTQSSVWLHFGLGVGSTISQVEVTWPNQQNDSEVFTSIDANHRYELKQGSGVAKQSTIVREELALTSSIQAEPIPDTTMRIPVLHPLKAPPLGYYDFDGVPHDFDLNPQQVTLVNLWSTSCLPCVKELSEFTQRHADLEKAGVRVLALSIDEMEGTPNARAAAKAMAERLKFPFAAGMAPPKVIEEIQRYHNVLIKMNRPLPMPSSFLIDRDGRLSVIYKGTVSVDTLIEDSKVGQLTLLERFKRSSFFDGTVLDSEILNASIEKNHAGVSIVLAKQYFDSGRLDDAAAIYRDAVEQNPNALSIYNELALISDLQNKPQESIAYYRKALDLEPDNADLNVGLAQVLIRERKNDEAKKLLDQAIVSEPEHANAHYNLGVIYSSIRDTKNEKASYEATLKHEPNHAQALFRMGRLYEQQKDIKNAKKFYFRALKSAPDEVAVLTSVGRILILDKKSGDAVQVLLKAVQENPRYPEAHYQLGLALVAEKKTEEARKQFNMTLQLSRNHRGAYNALQQLGQQ